MPRNREQLTRHAERQRNTLREFRRKRAEQKIAGDSPFAVWAKESARELVNQAGEGWNLDLYKNILGALAKAYRTGVESSSPIRGGVKTSS
jgi:hypothetical protein